ncbi:glycosyl hydrolase [Pedobacter sp. SAFR-022]|uniref:glycosyl hydrolase n=1 Tax=Pedobacter sp. SAFR-022 TaxID=3436861 RepID=UPI003F7F158B
MKINSLFRWTSALLLTAVGLSAVGQQAVKPPGSFAALAKQFKTPDKQFGSAPLWVWNANVTEGKIDSMLLEFKANAFGGVFVHPRPGLITPYLSKTWSDLYRYTVQRGKALGLEVWIYDENSYPSGFAGGHVPEAMPESYNQGQMLHLRKADLVGPADKVFLALKSTGSGFQKVDPAGKQDKGTYYLFEKQQYERTPWYGGYSYVDLMVKGVTEKFIEVTMKGYEQFFGNEFGKTVPGIFTDEPNIEVQGSGNIRWTPDLFEVFKARWGYDLETHLPSLFEEIGDWKKVRHNYYQVLLQLFIDRWSKPWQQYTDAKNLEWTGHYWEHGWPNPNHGGDNMAMYAWHQRPGIDMLFNQFDEESANAQFGNVRAVKELASVANQLGKKRTLSETYGGGGWELTFQDLKRLGDWEFVLGVNSLNQHLAYMTLVGARKYDYPQSFSYHNPWWPHYEPLNRYFSRLSLALSSGNQVNDILILEPTTATWMYSAYEKPNARRNEIGQQFQSFVTRLEKQQLEYDLGSENIIKDHGKVAKNMFVVGNRQYSKVILPPGMENLDQSTAGLLKRFVQQGGELIVLEQVKYIDGSPAAEALTDINNKRCQEGSNDAALLQSLKSKTLSFDQASLTKGKLYHHRRVLSDGELLFLVNSSLEEPVKGSFQVKQKQVVLLDLMTGERYRYPSTASGASTQVKFELPAAGSMLFFLSDAKMDDYPIYQLPKANSGKEVTASTTVKYMEPNVLTLDFVDVNLGAATLKGMQVYHASDTIFKHFGFTDGNPWNTSVQYKDNIIKRDTLTSGGFSVDYHFNVDGQVDLKSIQLAIERPWLWTVELNGTTIKANVGSWYLDKEILGFDVGTLVKAGQNTLRLKSERMRVYSEVEPVYVLGNFDLKAAAKGFDIIPATAAKIGSWKSMGRPMYGKLTSYSKTLKAVAGKSYQVGLKEWKGTAAILFVNGEKVADLSYAPYASTLKGLKPGNNLVEIQVIGSLKNTLGPHHNRPKPGLVSPWLWRGVKSFPSGTEYDLYDYGLLQDFQITALN